MNTSDKASFWDKKPFEKTQTPTAGEEKTLNDILNEKPKWMSFDYDFEKVADRIRFMITLCVIGFGVILIGDILHHVTFKTSGTFAIVIGALIIAAGFITPIVKWLNDNI